MAVDTDKHWGTGKRKSSVARVRLLPGSGDIVVNRRTLEDYFPRETLRMIIAQPLEVTSTVGQFDIFTTVGGGGPTGQAGAVRHGLSRALARFDEKFRLPLKKAGLLTEEVRPARRPAKVPVLEAVMATVRVAVAGASGYMGAELLRLLCVHPHITLTGVTSDRLAGEALTKAYPHLRGLSELRFHDLDAEWLASVADVVFLALPHMESQKAVPILRARGRRAIVLAGADMKVLDLIR